MLKVKIIIQFFLFIPVDTPGAVQLEQMTNTRLSFVRKPKCGNFLKSRV